MDIWIIQDGDKRGPFQEFEIRRRFEAGEIDADTRVWHAHLEDWKPLREVEALKHLVSELREPVPAEPQPDQSPPLLPEQPATPVTPNQDPEAAAPLHLGRRFWARWLDLCLYSALWWLLMWASGRDIGALFRQPWIVLLHYLPWFALEAWLIHRFSTTPGKHLLGIKVINQDGTPLDLGMSIARSLRVFFMGIGFGVQPLALICQGLGWITAKRLGTTLWDRAGKHLVDVRPLPGSRVLLCLMLFPTFLWLESIVLMPHYLPQMIEQLEPNFPDTARQLRENPPWHLPVR